MSPEAQRISIAETCGWYNISESHRALGHVLGPAGFPPRGTIVSTLPDYLADMNAMNEAEKVLTLEQYEAYLKHLLDCIWKPEIKQIEAPAGGWWKITTYEMPKLMGASAAQRAEAFLRTIGKWTDNAKPADFGAAEKP